MTRKHPMLPFVISALISGAAIALVGESLIKDREGIFLIINDGALLIPIPGIAFSIAFGIHYRQHVIRNRFLRTGLVWTFLWMIFYITSFTPFAMVTIPLWGGLGAYFLAVSAKSWHSISTYKSAIFLFCGVLVGLGIFGCYYLFDSFLAILYAGLEYYGDPSHHYGGLLVFSWQVMMGYLWKKGLDTRAIIPKIDEIGNQTAPDLI